MPAIPIVIDVDALRRGVNADLAVVTRNLHSIGHVILRRGTDNHIAEVVAVGMFILQTTPIFSDHY